MIKEKLDRVRKAVASAVSGALTAGLFLVPQDFAWPVTAGVSASVGLLLGAVTFLTGNKLGAAELREALEQATRDGRP